MIEYSVIVPVYNVENVLRRCIESILNQTITNFELLLIDDGSSDKSGLICDEYQHRDDRVKVIHQKNAGVSAARNKGLEEAKGKYIVFVDSDDYVDKEYLENFSDLDDDLIISGYVIKGCGITKEIVQNPGNIRISIDENDTLLHLFEKGWFSYIWSKRYKKSIIQDNLFFDNELTLGEDTLFNLDYVSRILTIRVLDETPYHYVKYSSGTLTSLGKKVSIEMISKFEESNRKIRVSLQQILGINIDKVMAIRMGEVYHHILALQLREKDVNYGLIKYIYKQKEFINTIKYADIVYADESKKFRLLLKTKSAVLFWMYLKLQSIRRTYGTKMDNHYSTKE